MPSVKLPVLRLYNKTFRESAHHSIIPEGLLPMLIFAFDFFYMLLFIILHLSVFVHICLFFAGFNTKKVV